MSSGHMLIGCVLLRSRLSLHYKDYVYSAFQGSHYFNYPTKILRSPVLTIMFFKVRTYSSSRALSRGCPVDTLGGWLGAFQGFSSRFLTKNTF